MQLQNITAKNVLLTLDPESKFDLSPYLYMQFMEPLGTTANGPKAEKAYDKPGVYAATLWVSDEKGRRDVDFCRVKVHQAENPQFLPTIVIAHFPTRPIVGQPIHFRGWVQTEEVKEKMTIDFGDGTVLENRLLFHDLQRDGVQLS